MNDEKLEELIFNFMKDKERFYFILEDILIDKGSERLAYLFKETMRKNLYNNESLFRESLYSISVFDFSSFWKKSIDNELIFKVFSDKVLWSSKYSHNPLVFTYGEEIIKKAVKYAKKKYKMENGMVFLAPGEKPRGVKVNYEFCYGGEPDESGVCYWCKEKTDKIKIKELDNEEFDVCEKEGYVFMNLNQQLRHFFGWKIND